MILLVSLPLAYWISHIVVGNAECVHLQMKREKKGEKKELLLVDRCSKKNGFDGIACPKIIRFSLNDLILDYYYRMYYILAL